MTTLRRSNKYKPRIATRLCEHIAMGATVRQAIEKEPLGPNIVGFWKWIDEEPEFRIKYDRALRIRADLIADTRLEMAQNVLKNPRFAPAYKVAADILQWEAEVRNQEKYGSKTTIAVKKELNPEDLKRELRMLEEQLGIIDVKTLAIEGPAEHTLEEAITVASAKRKSDE